MDLISMRRAAQSLGKYLSQTCDQDSRQQKKAFVTKNYKLF